MDDKDNRDIESGIDDDDFDFDIVLDFERFIDNIVKKAKYTDLDAEPWESWGWKRPPKGIRTKQSLLDLAKKEFAKNGFFRTTIETITKRAMVNKAIFYRYFKSKEDIVITIIQELTDTYDFIEADIPSLIDSEAKRNKKEVVSKLIYPLLEALHANKEAYTIARSIGPGASKRLLKAKKDNMDKMEMCIKQILSLGIKRKLFKTTIDKDFISSLLLTLLYNTPLKRIKSKKGMREYSKKLADFILKGIGSQATK